MLQRALCCVCRNGEVCSEQIRECLALPCLALQVNKNIYVITLFCWVRVVSAPRLRDKMLRILDPPAGNLGHCIWGRRQNKSSIALHTSILNKACDFSVACGAFHVVMKWWQWWCTVVNVATVPRSWRRGSTAASLVWPWQCPSGAPSRWPNVLGSGAHLYWAQAGQSRGVRWMYTCSTHPYPYSTFTFNLVTIKYLCRKKYYEFIKEHFHSWNIQWDDENFYCVRKKVYKQNYTA